MIKNKEYLIYSSFFVLYLISYFFMLLNYEGLYSDDWTVYNQSTETVGLFMNMLQTGIKGPFMEFIISLGNQIYPTRIIIFLIYFLIAIFFYNILKTVKELNKTDIFFLTLFFLILPLNDSRLMICIAPFSLPLFLFFLSFFLLSKYLNGSNSLILRLLILSLFYFSFDTNSILIFYAITLIYIYYINFGKIISKDNIKLFVFKYLDFIFLPIIYFIVKNVFFKPWGAGAGYNSLSLNSFIASPYYVLRNMYETLYSVLTTDIQLGIAPILFIIITLLYRKISKSKQYTDNKLLIFILLGLIFYILGVFAYSVAGKTPNFDSVNTRHQLLTPLGVSFILYFMILYITNKLNMSKQILLTVLWVFIISFTIKNINNQFTYIKNWMYHESVLENFRNSNIISNNHTFIVKFNPDDEKLLSHPYAYYELNGMLKKVFGDDSRNMQISEVSIKLTEIYKKYKHYNFSTWEYTKPIYLTINIHRVPSNRTYLKLLYYKYFKKNIYTTKISVLSSFEYGR